jgi:hypothetical protein
MDDIAIRVENLSKQYRIGGPQARYKTIRESLTEAVQNRDRETRGTRGQGEGFFRSLSPPHLVSLSQEVSPSPCLHLPHHRADGGLCRNPWASGQPAGGGHWLPPRTDRAGEHLPQRGHPFDRLRTSLGMKKTDFQFRICNFEIRNSLACTCAWPLPWPPTVRLGSRRRLEPETLLVGYAGKASQSAGG